MHMESSARREALSWVAVLLASLAVGATVSVLLGQDANWDLRNYHLYNPWALLNNRTQLDIFPAGKETFYAPLLDLPYYVLALKWLPNHPRLVAGLMGLPYGLVIFLVFHISWITLAEFENIGWRRAVVAALATIFGVSGVATISSVGSTFNEVPNAAIMLLAVTLILDQGRATADEGIAGGGDGLPQVHFLAWRRA